jgi:hypothetical protein
MSGGDEQERLDKFWADHSAELAEHNAEVQRLAEAAIAREKKKEKVPRKKLSKDEEIDRALSVEWFRFRATQLRFDAIKHGDEAEPSAPPAPFKPQPARPRPNLKAIAELGRRTVRLGRPVPQWALLWLFDLMDPPKGSLNDWKWISKARGRGRQHIKAMASDVETALKIKAAAERLGSLNRGIAEVMGPEEGPRRDGRKLLARTRHLIKEKRG